jgi:hypothetical protein
MLKRLVCLVMLAVPVTAASQTPGRLAFSATLDSIRVHARPNEVVTRQFQLTLDENQPRTHFRARVEDYWRSEDGRESFYGQPGTLRRSCGPWVSINPVDAVVGPGETLTVRTTVNVPAEVLDGGFWCVLTVDEVPDPEARQAGVGVRFLASVSTGIFVYVGEVDRDASIVDLDLAGEEVRIRVQNDGNAPVGIEGQVEWLQVGSDTPVATVDLPRFTVFTEPMVQGLLRAPLPAAHALPDGRYLMRAILDFDGDHYIGAEREVTVVRAGEKNGGDR